MTLYWRFASMKVVRELYYLSIINYSLILSNNISKLKGVIKSLLKFLYETSMKKHHLHTSEGMPSAKGMIIMRVPSDLNKKL